MATRFTIQLPDEVMVQLTEAATKALRTPKAQAEWELRQRFTPPPALYKPLPDDGRPPAEVAP